MSLEAQSDNGTINGLVKDQSGAVVPGAVVTVKNEASGTERTAASNAAGLYSVTNLPPGAYTVTVTAKNFKKFESNNNKLDPSSTLAVEAALPLGPHRKQSR